MRGRKHGHQIKSKHNTSLPPRKHDQSITDWGAVSKFRSLNNSKTKLNKTQKVWAAIHQTQWNAPPVDQFWSVEETWPNAPWRKSSWRWKSLWKSGKESVKASPIVAPWKLVNASNLNPLASVRWSRESTVKEDTICEAHPLTMDSRKNPTEVTTDNTIRLKETPKEKP